MNGNDFQLTIEKICEIIRAAERDLTFTILEIGAIPVDGQTEPFHQLLDHFPGSRIIAFEVDKDICEQLNKKSKSGLTYYPVALGRTEEKRTFYETNNPMCCSLYKPNEQLISMYNNMELAMLKSTSTIDTFSLDYFAAQNNIESVDFIKIDIQGAELDVFEGAVTMLKDVVSIVSEVEFIPHYLDQPLFGDVCAFLAKNRIMFHKFLGMAGRSLKPTLIRNNPNYPVQHIWTDAMFITDVLKIHELPSSKLLKLGLLAFIYGSPDVTFLCFKTYDDKNDTQIHKDFSAI